MNIPQQASIRVRLTPGGGHWWECSCGQKGRSVRPTVGEAMVLGMAHVEREHNLRGELGLAAVALVDALQEEEAQALEDDRAAVRTLAVEAIARALEAVRWKELELAATVAAARNFGASWAAVAQALGISRQAAWARFGAPHDDASERNL